MASSSSPLAQDRLPDWLAEALDVLGARRRLVVSAAVGLVLVGAIVSLLAPSILPARPVVGVAVGIAAALLATALALALDASDLMVRGARHVRAAGGTVDVRVARAHDDVGPLLAAVARHATDGAVRVALTPASRTAAVPGPRATALAEALARTGRRVLLTDLTRGGSPAAGLSDVVAGERTLPEVVRFEEGLHLARLAVGSDPDLAIRRFGAFVDVLPSDLEVLVVALPPLAEPGVLRTVEAFDLSLVLVEVDRTERVDLIASLDAMDATRATSELVLIDPGARGPQARPAAADEAAAEDTAAEPDTTDADTTHADDVDATTPVEDLAAREDDTTTAVGADAPPEDGTPAAVGADAPPEDAGDAEDDDRAEPDEASEADDDRVAAAATANLSDLAGDPDAPSRDADPTDEVAVVPPPGAATSSSLPKFGPASDPDPEPAAEPEPAPEPEPHVARDPEPAPEPEPEPTPRPTAETEPEPATVGARSAGDAPSWVTRAPSWASGPVASADQFDEDVVEEVARTSAALQQLAQQVWQRQAT